jgi:hypothetical protein
MVNQKTVHERLAEDALEDILENPKFAVNFNKTALRLQRDEFDRDYRDVIGQTHSLGGKWPPHQVAAFLHVHAGLMGGSFASVQIEVGTTPQADRCRNENADALAGLPSPFTAHVDSGQNRSGDGDGWFEWTGPITTNRSTGKGRKARNGETHPVMGLHQATAPHGAALEIGTTKPSVTMNHLYGPCAGVARWPYGSKFVTLLLNVGRFDPAISDEESAGSTSPTIEQLDLFTLDGIEL